MKKRLILHIGMHKTGSSSIQRFFSRNRTVLRRLGIVYPDCYGTDGRRQPKHNTLFTAISHEADFGAPHPELGPSAGLIDALGDQIEAAPGRCAVVSAEGFSGERPVFAAALAPWAERFDVDVIMFVRRQDLWVESFYKQMVMSREVRLTDTFTDFLNRPETQAHMDYAAIASWWGERFKGSVRIAPFEPAIDRSPPLNLFLTTADLSPWLRALPFARARENPAPPKPQIEALRKQNALEAGLAFKPNHDAGEGAEYLNTSSRMTLLKPYDKGNRQLLSWVRSSSDEQLFRQPIK